MQSQLIPEIGNQTDFINKTDQMTAASYSFGRKKSAFERDSIPIFHTGLNGTLK